MALRSCQGDELYTTDKAGVMSGNWKRSLAFGDEICAAVGKSMVLPPESEQTAEFKLSFGKTLESAVKLTDFTDSNESANADYIKINTPDRQLNNL